MKKFLLSAVVAATIIGSLTLTGCKKEEKTTTTPTPSYACASCSTAPDAKAANDNISKGIYKGIIVGSSGTIKFDIMNNDTTIKAYMVIDGTSVTLTATVAWASGAAYVSPFTGTLNGEAVSITFSVGADGGTPTITAMNIPGHPNASLTISKETSTNLIKCFEGTYKNTTSGETGNFDLFLSTSLKKWSAKVKSTGGSKSIQVDGTFDGTKLSYDYGQGNNGSATLSGDNIINGVFTTDKPENGTWEAKRTL
ncbi:MAG: hypothetical protein JWQ38_2006 [Flavipsychrobacter sp.]|nr:hypothetical protein [Flavipsychrobacter sp.]